MLPGGPRGPYKTHCIRGHEIAAVGRDKGGLCYACKKIHSSAWARANPEKKRANTERSRKNNPEQARVCTAAYRKRNPEKARDCAIRWKKNNPNKIRAYNNKRQARKLNQLGLWHQLEIKLVPLMRKAQQGQCIFCKTVMGPDLPKQHPQKETLEHMTPLSRGGSHGIDNWALSCWKCNDKKRIKTAEEFRGEYGGKYSPPLD